MTTVDLRELLRIDIEAELRKLTVAQLQGPWQMPAELVRRAVRAGASEIDVKLGRGSCSIRDDGPPLPVEQLRELAAMPTRPRAAVFSALDYLCERLGLPAERRAQILHHAARAAILEAAS